MKQWNNETMEPKENIKAKENINQKNETKKYVRTKIEKQLNIKGWNNRLTQQNELYCKIKNQWTNIEIKIHNY